MKLKLPLILFTILFISNCASVNPKQIELCVILINGDLYCRDNRISKESYTKQKATNYLCTNPDDFNSVLSENIILNGKE